MIKGRKIVGFLQSHKMFIVLMFLFILFAISIASAGTLTADPISGSAPLYVEFTYTPSENVSSQLWNFGDGNTLSTSASIPR
jgi:PKD repeat protein